MLDIIRYTLIENHLLKWHIFYSSVMGTATLTMAWFVQPCLDYFQISLGLYGVIIPLLNLTAGFMAIHAWKVETRLGQDKTTLFIVFSISIGYLMIGNLTTNLAIFSLFLFYLARGIATPVLRNYINEITPSEIRATVLSIRSLVIRLSFVIVGPLLGWFADISGVPVALTVGGVLFFIGGVGSGVALMRSTHEATSSLSPPKASYSTML
jgi:MFS family permease